MPDAATWTAGHNRGLQQYCTPQNAYSIGRDGTKLSNVCGAEALTELNRANVEGLKCRAISREMSSLRTRFSDNDTKLFFLGTPQTGEQIQERRRPLEEQEKIKTWISNLELQRIDYSVL